MTIAGTSDWYVVLGLDSAAGPRETCRAYVEKVLAYARRGDRFAVRVFHEAYRATWEKRRFALVDHGTGRGGAGLARICAHRGNRMTRRGGRGDGSGGPAART